MAILLKLLENKHQKRLLINKLIAKIDEFLGAWQALGKLKPENLNLLKKVAGIESIGSSTRIEVAKLSNSEVERLLSNLGAMDLQSRDEEEVENDNYSFKLFPKTLPE